MGICGDSDDLCMDIPGGSLGAGLEADFWTEMPGGSRGGCPDMMKPQGSGLVVYLKCRI